MLEFGTGRFGIKVSDKALKQLSDFFNSRVGLAFLVGLLVVPFMLGIIGKLDQMVISTNRVETMLAQYQNIPEGIAEIKALIIAYSGHK